MVCLLDQPGPGAATTTGGADAGGRTGRKATSAGNGAIAADQLLSGVGELGAQSGQEIERQQDA